MALVPDSSGGWSARRLFLLAILGVAVVGGLWAARRSWRGPSRGLPPLPTAYRNARPGVDYVGDAACAKCHPDIAATYREHPMGQSLVPIAEAPAAFRGEATPAVLFEDRGARFSLERRDGRTIHRETYLDDEGRVLGEVEGEVRYVLGSGRLGHSFLIQRDDFLFESPVTWFADHEQHWALSPGFEGRNDHYGRQIAPGCLTCHANRVDHVEGTEGRYRPPIFRGHAIGCERCHGPGELHVREPQGSPGAGPSIVNPRDLPPALRDDVCNQCHLSGTKEIDRYGREPTDYRPGLPLQEFVTSFVPPGAPGEHPNVDHAEQLAQSLCFRASEGALGCISCHDPHELPPPAEKAAYYNDRCLTCHADPGCALPAAERLARGPADDCIACHMPRAPTTDIPHVATTLHLIPRDGERTLAMMAAAPAPPADPMSLVPFHADRRDPESIDRDFGVMLRHEQGEGAARAVTLLRKALDEHPDDLLARESLGFALLGLGFEERALEAFEAVLDEEPDRLVSLEAVALVLTELGLRDRAIAAWRRALAVDPWRPKFHAVLALELNRDGRWSEASAAAERALRLNPASHDARFALSQALFGMGSPEEARAQFETLLEFDPPHRDELLRWFSSQH